MFSARYQLTKLLSNHSMITKYGNTSTLSITSRWVDKRDMMDGWMRKYGRVIRKKDTETSIREGEISGERTEQQYTILDTLKKGEKRVQEDEPFLKLNIVTKQKKTPKGWKVSRKREIEGISGMRESEGNVSLSGVIYDESMSEPIKEFYETHLFEGYKYAQEELLVRALTNKSYGTGKVPSNESLCFVGNQILQHYVMECVMEKYYDHLQGNSNMIQWITAAYTNSTQLCYMGSQEWNMVKLIRCQGWSLMTYRKHKSIISDSVKSIIGSIFVDQGAEKARSFVRENIFAGNPRNIVQKLLEYEDEVVLFNDYTSSRYEKFPRVIEQVHEDGISCSLYIDKHLLGFGKALDSQASKRLAAASALNQIIGKLPEF